MSVGNTVYSNLLGFLEADQVAGNSGSILNVS